jgi:hypothetical protein
MTPDEGLQPASVGLDAMSVHGNRSLSAALGVKLPAISDEAGMCLQRTVSR